MATNQWDDMPIISVYTREQAIEDGVLIPVGSNNRVCLTDGAVIEYNLRSDKDALISIFAAALTMLATYMNAEPFCVDLPDGQAVTLWLSNNSEEGITIMRPEDY